jgi:hypothetical protein
MLKELSWFESRIGSVIYRGKTEVFVDSLATANKLFYVQDKKYTFEDVVK